MATEFLDQTVGEYMFKQCSRGVLSECAEESEYWQTCEDFVLENEDRVLNSLTYKQRAWLIKIKEALLE